VQALQAQHEQALAGQTAAIRTQAQSEAETQRLAAQTRGEGKLSQAVETILRAVLP
jgi:hypothetical protein